MFCRKCGAKNDDNATFCSSCGAKLYEANQQTANPDLATLVEKKNSLIAVILNFFFPGIGYWYWGYKKVLGIHPALVFIGWIVVTSFCSYLLYGLGLVFLALSLFVAYDLYVKTEGKPGWIEASK